MKHHLTVEIPDGVYDIDPSEWDTERLFHYLDAGYAEIVDHVVIFTDDEKPTVLAAVRAMARAKGIPDTASGGEDA